MNYGLIPLSQQDGDFKLAKAKPTERSAFGILPGLSHSVEEMGIMRSVKPDDDATHPAVQWVLRCLSVGGANAYRKLIRELGDLTDQTQQSEHVTTSKALFIFQRNFVTNRCCMLVFRIIDDRNNDLVDYDVVLTAGPD